MCDVYIEFIVYRQQRAECVRWRWWLRVDNLFANSHLSFFYLNYIGAGLVLVHHMTHVVCSVKWKLLRFIKWHAPLSTWERRYDNMMTIYVSTCRQYNSYLSFHFKLSFHRHSVHVMACSVLSNERYQWWYTFAMTSIISSSIIITHLALQGIKVIWNGSHLFGRCTS